MSFLNILIGYKENGPRSKDERAQSSKRTQYTVYRIPKKSMKYIIKIFALVVCLPFFSSSCHTSNQTTSLDLRDRVEKLVLDNGMTFLFFKRDGAPVFSANMMVKAGSVDEQEGQHGLAHFLEHMAFKGTDTIGTHNFDEEKKFLDQLLDVGTKIVEQRRQGKSEQDLASLVQERQRLETELDKYIVPNELFQIYQKNGGDSLNASTSNDYTSYTVALPAQKLELWAYIESQRLKHFVMRQFFSENDVVAEERRKSIDNVPRNRLYEAYMGAAFTKNPYHWVIIGPLSEIQTLTPKAVQTFRDTFYTPSRIVVALAGNYDVALAKKIAQQYFGDIPSKQGDVPVPQSDSLTPGPKEVVLTGPDKPRFYLGYHRPAYPDPDDAVLDVIEKLLCEGRTSRLYQKLVLKEKKAFSIGCSATMPGVRMDSLFSFYGMPFEGVTNKQLKEGVLEEIANLAKNGPTLHELQKVQNNIDADFIYSLQSNDGVSGTLGFYQQLCGDWTCLFDWQKQIHAMTIDDIKRVVQKYFVPEREVAAYLEQKME